MRIIQLTPGAGAMFCGNCLRDNAVVASLRALGHDALMVPLYLPLTLDEPDQSASTPIFFSGINVYLEQKSAFFRHAPNWVHRFLASRRLLKWAAKGVAKTRASDLGELTLSMLRGEAGNQARELDELIGWLKAQAQPDVICLSNALLIGMARKLRQTLAVPVICMLQGEDSFLDSLPDSHRKLCWQTLADRASAVDLFIAPSRYFAEFMGPRLGLAPERIEVVYNGINLDGYEVSKPSGSGLNMEKRLVGGNGEETASFPQASPPMEERERRPAGGSQKPGPACESEGRVPVLGFFARMCREKGLDTLVDAFIQLRKRGRVPQLKLRVGGSCGPADEPLVEELRRRLERAGLAGYVQFCPNLTRSAKIAFLRGLTVFSVPARYGEAFGLYVLEALAAGVPVVQPRSSAFPELVEATGGGVVCDPGSVEALAGAIEDLLVRPDQLRALGETGRKAVFERFSAEVMTARLLEVLSGRTVPAG